MRALLYADCSSAARSPSVSEKPMLALTGRPNDIAVGSIVASGLT
jgi:hypothetical protein